MESIKELNRKVLFLLLGTTVSLILYIIVIKEWFVIYEIFFDIPLFLMSIGSFGLLLIIIIEVFKKKVLPQIFLMIAFIIVASIYFAIYSHRNGLFWGKRLDAAFIDDRSRMDLILFNNDRYIIYSNWLFGEERFEGKYKIKGDTLIFQTSPVIDNDFINEKAIINYKEKKIYFHKDKDGNYDRDFYYFQIDF
jgi:hypothetical protein